MMINKTLSSKKNQGELSHLTIKGNEASIGKSTGFLGIGRKVYIAYEGGKWGLKSLNIFQRAMRFLFGSFKETHSEFVKSQLETSGFFLLKDNSNLFKRLKELSILPDGFQSSKSFFGQHFPASTTTSRVSLGEPTHGLTDPLPTPSNLSTDDNLSKDDNPIETDEETLDKSTDKTQTQQMSCDISVEDFISILDSWVEKEGGNAAIAANEIKKAFIDKDSNLSLGYMDLKTLPIAIGFLIKLQDLRLLDNEIQTIPDSIGNLANLETLYLGINNIQTFQIL